MGKIALLVSREEMLHQAHNILQEKRLEIQEMRVIRTENAVTEARRSIADGASIIIARGLQASLIKQYTDIPVVEIVLTAQEMALLVMKAKQIVKKPRPVIAVVGFQNMFCDMSYFDELYGIELRTYFARQGAGLPGAVRSAMEDQADLIIGGDTAVTLATQAGVPSLFLSMTEDSMRQAFSMAESMDYAMSVEKKTAAQIETISDYSFSGIMRMDADGLVTAVNPVMEDLFGKPQEKLCGQNVRTLVPSIGEEALRKVLGEGKDYSLTMEIGHVPLYVLLAPVLYESRVDGAIMSCHRVRRSVQVPPKSSEKERGQKGLPPLVRFDDILQESPAMQECIRLAGLYALSEHPVVLSGEPGTEKRMIAESIHNSGSRSRGPFLDVPCEGLTGEEQRNMIFGERGAVLQAQGGTLLLRDLEYLTSANQYRLYQLIRFRVCYGADIASLRKVSVRVMATVGEPLALLADQGRISRDLYYLLSGLELAVPPLRERPEDLSEKLEETLQDCCDRYSRYHVLTAGAKQLLIHYPWRGNLFQIESFFERLILTADRRSLDENVVRALLNELYPENTHRKVWGGVQGDPDLGEAVRQRFDQSWEQNSSMRVGQSIGQNIGRNIGQGAGQGGRRGAEQGFAWNSKKEPAPLSERAQVILDTLKKYGGNREQTAKELKVSKSTLWRLMKKYNINW